MILLLRLFLLLLLPVILVGACVGACAAGNSLANLDQSGEKVQVVRLEGEIIDAEPVVADLRAARENSNVRAVVLRIESHGGGAASSQEIHDAVRATDAVKPVVASIGNVGASGGFYVAMGARTIVANPGSVVGSIGVVSQFPRIDGLLEKLGLEVRTLRAGEAKDDASPFRPLGRADSLRLQRVLDDIHRQFRTTVAEGRDLSPSALDTLADGRILTGYQALEMGLVDTLGSLELALQVAREQAGLPLDAPIHDPRPKPGLLERFVGRDLDRVIRNRQLPILRMP